MPTAIVPAHAPAPLLSPGRADESWAAPGFESAHRRSPPRWAGRRPVGPAPEDLHPALWRGNPPSGHAGQDAAPSGFAALDAQLPGAGWPRRALTELLLPHPGVGEVRLMVPSLVDVQRRGRLVMLFDPPAVWSAGALAQWGLDVEALLVIQTDTPEADSEAGADARLWALEQTLRSGHVGAVLAWLPPRLGAARLRRLQLAAHAHDGPAFMLRELAARRHPSAAPLRLALQPAGRDRLDVQLLKRRGAPLEKSLILTLPPVLKPGHPAASVPQSVLNATVSTPSAQGSAQGSAQSPRLCVATFVNLA